MSYFFFEENNFTQEEISNLIKGFNQFKTCQTAIDCFMIGYLYSKKGDKNLKTLQVIKDKIQTINDLRESGYIDLQYIVKLYQKLLNSNKVNYEEQLTQEINQIMQQPVQLNKESSKQDMYQNLPQLDKRSSSEVATEKLIKQMMEEDQKQIHRNKLIEQQDEEMAKKAQKIFEEEEKQSKRQREIEDELLAKKAQQELEQERKKIIEEKYNKDYQDKNCGICIMPLFDDKCWPLECNHMFHQQCLQTYFKTMIDDRKFPIKCPEETCKDEACFEDLSEMLDKDYLDKFNDYTFKNYVDMNQKELSWCPTADCKYVFIFDDQEPEFNCPLCKKKYCMNCRVPFHTGMTCKEYAVEKNLSEEDRQFQKFIKGQKFKQCPWCLLWVEKQQGCDYMACKCGKGFCYRCGSKVYTDHGACDCSKGIKINEQDYYYDKFVNVDKNKEEALKDNNGIPPQPQPKLNPINFYVPKKVNKKINRKR